jgi:hypothetical protein
MLNCEIGEPRGRGGRVGKAPARHADLNPARQRGHTKGHLSGAEEMPLASWQGNVPNHASRLSLPFVGTNMGCVFPASMWLGDNSDRGPLGYRWGRPSFDNGNRRRGRRFSTSGLVGGGGKGAPAPFSSRKPSPWERRCALMITAAGACGPSPSGVRSYALAVALQDGVLVMASWISSAVISR